LLDWVNLRQPAQGNSKIRKKQVQLALNHLNPRDDDAVEHTIEDASGWHGTNPKN
jgi:hypothetical protein